MPPKNKPFTVYPDDTTVIQIEELRKYYSEKQGGVKISDSFIGRRLIDEKHTEIVDRQNNRVRITTIVDEQRRSTEEFQELKKEFQELKKVNNELVNLIKGAK